MPGGRTALRCGEAAEAGCSKATGPSHIAGQALGSGGGGDWVLNLLFQTVLLGYIAIAVVNTLVMATAGRVREFAMLQLIGASRDQVRAMMNVLPIPASPGTTTRALSPAAAPATTRASSPNS